MMDEEEGTWRNPEIKMENLEKRADDMTSMVRKNIMAGETVIILNPDGMFINVQPGEENMQQVSQFFIEGLYKWSTGQDNKITAFTDMVDKSDMH